MKVRVGRAIGHAGPALKMWVGGLGKGLSMSRRTVTPLNRRLKVAITELPSSLTEFCEILKLWVDRWMLGILG